MVMKGLLDKVKGCFAEIASLTKVKIGSLNGVIKGIVIGFLVLVVILVMTFYAAWVWFFYQGKAIMGDLLDLIDRVISPQMVAFITFITTCFVDRDNDGIPDRFENEEEKKSGGKR